MVPGGVCGGNLGLAVVGVGDAVDAGVLAGRREPAQGVVGEIFLRAVGVSKRQQSVGCLAVGAFVIVVRSGQPTGAGDRKQVSGRVVEIRPCIAGVVVLCGDEALRSCT